MNEEMKVMKVSRFDGFLSTSDIFCIKKIDTLCLTSRLGKICTSWPATWWIASLGIRGFLVVPWGSSVQLQVFLSGRWSQVPSLSPTKMTTWIQKWWGFLRKMASPFNYRSWFSGGPPFVFWGSLFGVIFCCGGRLAWRFLERSWSWNHHTSYLLGPAQILVRSRKINVPLLCDLFPSVVFSRTQVIYLFVGSCVAPCIVEGMTAFWVNWKFLQVLWAGRGYIILLGYRLACKLLLARCKSSRKYHEKSSLSFKSTFT